MVDASMFMGGPTPDTLTDLRIPLGVPIGTRDGTMAKDGYMQNLFIDLGEDGKKYVQKRPGLSAYTTFNGGGAGTGQGIWFYNGFVTAAADNVLSRILSPTSSGFTTGAAWNSTVAPPYVGRQAHVQIVFGNSMYVIGGSNFAATGNDLADVWSTDDGVTWQQVLSAAPWGVRNGQQAVVFNNELYIMGGSTGGVSYNDVWKTSDGVLWTLVTSQAGWSPRPMFTATVFNNGIFVLGGISSAGDTNEVWFSTDGGTWIQLPNAAWSARDQHSSVVFNGKLFVIGGTTGGREVWYTTDGRTWTMATNTAFSNARRSFACTVYNGAIWVICGFDGAAYLTQVWKSTAADASTWVQVTAAFGGAARYQLKVAVFQAPPAAGSSIKARVMYLTGGIDGGAVYFTQVWWASIDGTLATTYAIPSTTPYQRLDAVTSNNTQFFVLKDLRGLYIWYNDQVTQVTDKNYPPVTVPGLVNLDETLYVMDPTGLIFGSAIIDPYTWPSRNFVGADYESDGGVALAKYQNYVVAFGIYTTQFLFNSGSQSQTLLRPQRSLNTKVGCTYPYSIVSNENTLCFVGRAETKNAQVFRFIGNSIAVISTPWVEKIINLWNYTDDVRGVAVKKKGHSWYVLTNRTAGRTLAYDLDTKHWAPWVYNGSFFPWFATATDGQNDYLLQDTVKSIVTADENTRSDAGTAIACQIVTNLQDNGTNKWKFCHRATLIADILNTTATLEYANDDYGTWSTPITLSLLQANKARPTCTRQGKYQRRAWRLTHSSATQDFRAEALEFELERGES